MLAELNVVCLFVGACVSVFDLFWRIMTTAEKTHDEEYPLNIFKHIYCNLEDQCKQNKLARPRM